MPDLNIPEEYLRGAKSLIDVEDEVFRAILNAISKVSPASSVEAAAIALAAEVKGINLENLEEITQMVVSLQMHLNGRGGAFIDNLVMTLETDLFDCEETSDYSDDQVARFRRRIHELLRADGIFRTIAKTLELRIESERILADARIVTDARPIFQDEVERGIVAMFATHTLRITYRDATGQKEFYTALDQSGLDVLLEQILRAKEKTQAIRSMLEKASIPYLEPYTD
ncbi:hypothetical protein [Phormidesmis sp. 146-33]